MLIVVASGFASNCKSSTAAIQPVGLLPMIRKQIRRGLGFIPDSAASRCMTLGSSGSQYSHLGGLGAQPSRAGSGSAAPRSSGPSELPEAEIRTRGFPASSGRSPAPLKRQRPRTRRSGSAVFPSPSCPSVRLRFFRRQSSAGRRPSAGRVEISSVGFSFCLFIPLCFLNYKMT